MGQAALARRENHSKRLYVGDSFAFGLRRVFPAEVLNLLRGQPHQALLIRTPRAALRACPQAEASLCRIDFREIHGRPKRSAYVASSGVNALKGQCKTGHAGSLQNRPCEMARDVILFIPFSPDQASLFWFSNSAAHI